MNPTEIMRIFIPATVTFLIGIALTPFLTHFLYAYRMWKPKAGKVALDGSPAETFNKLHEARDVGTPRFGGIVVWMSVLSGATLLSILALFFPYAFGAVAFVSRNQTWIPIVSFIAGSIVGLFDDLFEVQGTGGLRLRTRLLFVGTIALLCAWWFYSKIGVSSISVPLMGEPFHLGAWFIPFFVLVALCLYAGGVIDGIDGLAGGIFAIIFGAYAGIALFQQQMDIAALCAATVGGLLAFLWFNIPPARFYLSETGTMGLSLLLTSVAFLTDAVAGGRGVSVLPIIALPLAVTVGSNVLQVFGKKILKRKILRIAPLHHHFEAIGWPAYKVTMRYWIVGVVVAIIGMTLALV
jgi:phospho-N-acetylmuramoyl-pentapeptide-transferase